MGLGRWILHTALWEDDAAADYKIAKVKAAFEQIPGADVRISKHKPMGPDRYNMAYRRPEPECLPSLIEAVTYRFRGASMSNPAEDRAVREERIWRERDPIMNLRRRLLGEHGVAEATLDRIDHDPRVRVVGPGFPTGAEQRGGRFEFRQCAGSIGPRDSFRTAILNLHIGNPQGAFAALTCDDGKFH